MRVKLYWLEHCTPCRNLKKEFARLPAPLVKPIYIEHANISQKEKTKLGIKSYPTLAFFADDGRLLSKLEGYNDLEDIVTAYKNAARLEHIQGQHNENY
jgi:thioredoxin-related protein